MSSAFIGVETVAVNGCWPAGAPLICSRYAVTSNVPCFAERTRTRRRHRLNEEGEQLVHRSRSPFRDEVRPGNSAAHHPIPRKSAEMASGTLLRVRSLSGLRLGRGVGAGRNRLRLLASTEAIVIPTKAADPRRSDGPPRFIGSS